jgi:hypothetical protein
MSRTAGLLTRVLGEPRENHAQSEKFLHSFLLLLFRQSAATTGNRH